MSDPSHLHHAQHSPLGFTVQYLQSSRTHHASLLEQMPRKTSETHAHNSSSSILQTCLNLFIPNALCSRRIWISCLRIFSCSTNDANISGSMQHREQKESCRLAPRDHTASWRLNEMSDRRSWNLTPRSSCS